MSIIARRNRPPEQPDGASSGSARSQVMRKITAPRRGVH
jgi:hypothetical protein